MSRVLLSRVAAAVGVCLVAISPLLFSATVGHAQVGAKKDAKPPLDARAEQQLKKADIKYKVTPLNNFSVLVDTEQPRTQEVYVASVTEKYRSLEVREVWSKGLITKGAVPPETAVQLLTDTSKMGGWRIEKTDDGGYLVYFCVHVAAECDADTLKDIVLFVADVADAMEKKLTNKDDF